MWTTAELLYVRNHVTKQKKKSRNLQVVAAKLDRPPQDLRRLLKQGLGQKLQQARLREKLHKSGFAEKTAAQVFAKLSTSEKRKTSKRTCRRVREPFRKQQKIKGRELKRQRMREASEITDDQHRSYVASQNFW